MKKYKIISIYTLANKPKTDKVNKSRVGMIGYIKFFELPDNNSHMSFMDETYFRGFITSKVTDDKEEIDGKRTITTLNNIYILEEVCD